MKKTAEYLAFIVALFLIFTATLTYLAPHLGWRVDSVASGSMEPYLEVGSLVIIRPVSPETIEVGDIITFEPAKTDETVITHRVIGIESGSLFYFITNGDASSRHDAFTVPARNIVGKVCFNLPLAGYVIEFLKTPWGFSLCLCIPAIIIIVMYMISIRKALNKAKIKKAAS